MNNKKAVIRNVSTSLIYQFIAIIYGFIVPRIILGTFGSEINGLTSSLNQFLNYITLLEGGLSGVVMASLYKPLADNDMKKVSSILKATDQFFKKIAIIFIFYSVVVAAVYPLVVKTSFSWGYVFSLTIIIGISLFVQYFFSLTFRMLINADRKGYIIYLTQIIFTVVNLILTILAVKIYPEIHVLKLFNAIAYTLQPIIYNSYVRKNYKLNKKAEPDKKAISQRWDGFGQNVAYFIHTNTDVVVLTIFSTLTEVSVYSVYFMIANALKTLIVSIGTAVTPSLGNILVSSTKEEKDEAFDYYEFAIMAITAFSFLCGILLVTPFITVYTSGITDANYYRPVFGYVLMIAEAIYCLRIPYVDVAYASGKFRETAKYAYIEAALNIIISVALVIKLGILGVAIGTAVSMLYRYFAHVIYLKKYILFRPVKKWGKSIFQLALISLISINVCVILVNFHSTSYLQWFVQAFITALITGASIILVTFIFDRKLLRKLIHQLIKRN